MPCVFFLEVCSSLLAIVYRVFQRSELVSIQICCCFFFFCASEASLYTDGKLFLLSTHRLSVLVLIMFGDWIYFCVSVLCENQMVLCCRSMTDFVSFFLIVQWQRLFSGGKTNGYNFFSIVGRCFFRGCCLSPNGWHQKCDLTCAQLHQHTDFWMH